MKDLKNKLLTGCIFSIINHQQINGYFFNLNETKGSKIPFVKSNGKHIFNVEFKEESVVFFKFYLGHEIKFEILPSDIIFWEPIKN